MTSDKTPGTDGLPCEFYKVFWRDVSQILISALNYSYDAGKLSVSQRRGVIKLIPKKDTDPNLIKNWRPLTLLNCDYKIATKAIASRIKSMFPKLISHDQTGFIKDRFIGENLRLIDSVIKYTAAKDIPSKTAKPQKNSAKSENRIQNRKKTDTVVTSAAYRANYTNTLFHQSICECHRLV